MRTSHTHYKALRAACVHRPGGLVSLAVSRMYPSHESPINLKCLALFYRGAVKSLARPTSRCILFDGEDISFDASLIIYTRCPRRNVKYFGRVFLMLNYTDITQNTYIQR